MYHFERGQRHERPQVAYEVAAYIQLPQALLIHEGAEIRDVVVGDVKLYKILAGGERRNVVQTLSAQV